MRRPLAAPRGRVRTMGQSASAQVSFDVSQFVPPEIQSDIATGKSYYDSFTHSGVSIVNGRVELSPEAQQAVGDAITTTVEASVPVLGQALAVFLALAPKAGAGPGVCISDPPAGPRLDQLRSWSHFSGWQDFYGAGFSYGPPGSFEAYANAVLEYNYLLSANCFSDKSGSPAIVLASLIAAWNATHLGPTRTICRKGLHSMLAFATPPSGYDPIANALEEAAPLRYYRKQPPCPSWMSEWQAATTGTCNGYDYIGPPTFSSCFTINDGPARVVLPHHVLTLKFRPKVPVPAPVGVKRTTSAGGAGTLIAVGAVAGAAWYVSRYGVPSFLRGLTKRRPRAR